MLTSNNTMPSRCRQPHSPISTPPACVFACDQYEIQPAQTFVRSRNYIISFACAIIHSGADCVVCMLNLNVALVVHTHTDAAHQHSVRCFARTAACATCTTRSKHCTACSQHVRWTTLKRCDSFSFLHICTPIYDTHRIGDPRISNACNVVSIGNDEHSLHE